jgi:hypothetical protein
MVGISMDNAVVQNFAFKDVESEDSNIEKVSSSICVKICMDLLRLRG